MLRVYNVSHKSTNIIPNILHSGYKCVIPANLNYKIRQKSGTLNKNMVEKNYRRNS